MFGRKRTPTPEVIDTLNRLERERDGYKRSYDELSAVLERTRLELIDARQEASTMARAVLAHRDTAVLRDIRVERNTTTVELIFERSGELFTIAVYKSMQFDHATLKKQLLE